MRLRPPEDRPGRFPQMVAQMLHRIAASLWSPGAEDAQGAVEAHVSPGSPSPLGYCNKLLGRAVLWWHQHLKHSWPRACPSCWVTSAAGTHTETHTDICCFLTAVTLRQLTKAGSNGRTSPRFEARWDGHFTFSLSCHQEHLSQSLATPEPKWKYYHLISSTPNWQCIYNLCLTSCLFNHLH